VALTLEIPGRGRFKLTKIVFDLNGTLTVDGKLSGKTLSLLERVAEMLEAYILTADTLGSAYRISRDTNIKMKIISSKKTSLVKAYFVENLGPSEVIAVGNGANDARMLKKAALGVAVLGPEGCSTAALRSADLLVKNINDALLMILNPQRLIATLRR